MDGRVEVHRRAVAVAAGEDAAAHPAIRIVVHDDVLPLEDRLVIAAPLLDQVRATLLLDLVVRDLGMGRRLHADAPVRVGLRPGGRAGLGSVRLRVSEGLGPEGCRQLYPTTAGPAVRTARATDGRAGTGPT